MTTDTNVSTPSTNDDAGKKTTVRSTKRTNARTDFTKLIAAHAKRREIDTTRAGKELRAKARREFDAIAKADPSLLKAKTHANDGNRWPALNDKARDLLLKPKART